MFCLNSRSIIWFFRFQLPAHAQWANSTGANNINNGPTLSEIQQMEAEKAIREQEEQKKQMMLEMQRQQLASIQKQQQQQQKTWAQHRLGQHLYI